MPREVVAIAEPEQSENFFTLGPFRFTTLKFLELILGGIMLLGLRGPFIIPGLLLVILSLWPSRVMAVERILIAYFTGSPKPKRSKKREEEARPRVIEVSENVPLKLSGFAVDPATGTALANAKIEVLVDGEPIATSVSDEQGKYSIILTDLSKGLHDIKVLVNGKEVKTFKVKVI